MIYDSRVSTFIYVKNRYYLVLGLEMGDLL